MVKKATFNTKVYPFSEKNIKVLLIFADFLAYFRNYTYLCTPKAAKRGFANWELRIEN